MKSTRSPPCRKAVKWNVHRISPRSAPQQQLVARKPRLPRWAYWTNFGPSSTKAETGSSRPRLDWGRRDLVWRRPNSGWLHISCLHARLPNPHTPPLAAPSPRRLEDIRRQRNRHGHILPMAAVYARSTDGHPSTPRGLLNGGSENAFESKAEVKCRGCIRQTSGNVGHIRVTLHQKTNWREDT